MNFQVPQFIEIEDKIFGPLTFKQFMYLAGGTGAAFLLHVYLPNLIEIIPIVGVVLLALALAFYKVNNRPFVALLESMFRYQIASKLYLWHKDEAKIAQQAEKNANANRSNLAIPKLSPSKLSDLAWSLDIKETTK